VELIHVTQYLGFECLMATDGKYLEQHLAPAGLPPLQRRMEYQFQRPYKVSETFNKTFQNNHHGYNGTLNPVI